MACMGFSTLEADSRASASDASRFSSTELRVIDLAERVDAVSEISHESLLGRLAELLGMRLPSPLANPRLASLRRFASLARHHSDDVSVEDICALVEAGFTPGQAYGLLAWLGGKGHRAAT